MRTIKFRGKDSNNNGEWRYGSLLSYPDGGCVIVDFDGHEELSWDADPGTVGQFTGLHDKNGKEIYEGDIIKGITNAWHVIEYDPENARFVASFFGSQLNRCSLTKKWIDSCSKMVAGNIHDNPELMEGGEE